MAEPIKSQGKKEPTLHQIKVEVAGRVYPVLIQPSEEKDVLEIVNEINEKIKFFQQKYAKSDIQDCIAMAYLAFAAQVAQEKKHYTLENEAELTKKLEELNQKVKNINQK